MESLLSVAFDNLCSKSPDKIRKGLKQVDGLLAQICLDSPPPGRRRSAEPKTVKSLEDLGEDPAFAEFFRLQESFEWNVSTQLTETLDRLLSFPPQPASQIPLLIIRTLDTLTALLLLHPPSRALFARRPALLSLLDLLDPSFLAVLGHHADTALSAALSTLLAAILATPRTARAFEAADGLASVGRVIRIGGAAADRARDFLSAWLAPEAAAHAAAGKASTRSASSSQGSNSSRSASLAEARLELSGMLPASSKLRQASDGSDSSFASGVLGIDTVIRTPDEKSQMLKRALGPEAMLRGLFPATTSS